MTTGTPSLDLLCILYYLRVSYPTRNGWREKSIEICMTDLYLSTCDAHDLNWCELCVIFCVLD